MDSPKKTNEMTQVQKVQDRLTQSLLENIRQQESNFLSEIVEDAAQNRAQLPEPLFREHFLPFFSGASSIKDRSDIITKWIGIAGSPVAEVDVVNEQGQALFTVPGYYDTTVVDAMSRSLGKEATLSTIINRYNQQMTNIPQIAEKEVQKNLEVKSESLLQPSKNYQNNRERWETIFHHYGLNTPLTRQKEETVKTASVDDIEYD